MAASRGSPLAVVTVVVLAVAPVTGLLHCGGESDPTTAVSTEALATTADPSAESAATPDSRLESRLIGANHFQLSGGDIHVTYDLSGGVPVFTYDDAQSARGIQTFRGSDVLTETTVAGELVSVVIRRTIDSGSVTFSVLIPRVQVDLGGTTPVVTEAITAFHPFSVVPVQEPAQLDQYSLTPLQGAGSDAAGLPLFERGRVREPVQVTPPNN
jgi:hypothetical protein